MQNKIREQGKKKHIGATQKRFLFVSQILNYKLNDSLFSFHYY